MSRLDGILEQNLGVKKNSKYKFVLQVKDKTTKLPRDLTGYTAKMQIRKTRSGTGTLYQELVSPPSAGTGIDMTSASTGIVTILMDESVTNTFTWRTGYYDLAVIDSGGNPEHIMQGSVLVTPNVLS